MAFSLTGSRWYIEITEHLLSEGIEDTTRVHSGVFVLRILDPHDTVPWSGKLNFVCSTFVVL